MRGERRSRNQTGPISGRGEGGWRGLLKKKKEEGEAMFEKVKPQKSLKKEVRVSSTKVKGF